MSVGTNVYIILMYKLGQKINVLILDNSILFVCTIPEFITENKNRHK